VDMNNAFSLTARPVLALKAEKIGNLTF